MGQNITLLTHCTTFGFEEDYWERHDCYSVYLGERCFWCFDFKSLGIDGKESMSTLALRSCRNFSNRFFFVFVHGALYVRVFQK